MADDEGKQGDLKYYQNQPYDMEVDLNNDDEEVDNPNKKKKPKFLFLFKKLILKQEELLQT